MFVYCEKVANFWVEVEDFMMTFDQELIHFSPDTVLCNRIIINNPYHVKNFICLLAKQYIYIKKWQQKSLNIYEFKRFVIDLKNKEKYIATVNDKLKQYAKKLNDRELLNDLNNHDKEAMGVQDEYVNEYINEIDCNYSQN